ncbi:NLI interacting factor-like phosphatase-domain-containing protein [Flammula alnicola]|nr:NLI interacting factor-like phosphatase-domain-containing protein [Flammula alnicola]
MNTLGYVARQFDVLASPKTPPSTPTSERQQPSLPRVSTWSTKSFLFPPYPKRSQSSPSFHSATPPTTPLPPTPPAPPLDVAPKPPRSKAHLESVIDQIFFIRVFLMADFKGKAKEAAADLVIESNLALSIARSIANRTPSSLSISAARRQESLSAVQGEPTQSQSSRAATPSLPAKKTPFHLQPKTLVLDLDETLIHSTSRPIPFQSSGSGLLSLGSFGRPNKGAGHMVEVVLGGRSTLYHVYKRPFVDFFLRKVSGWYTLVIFTASMQEYADPVIDWLDAGRGILEHRFFRDLPNGSYTKDLSVVDPDLSRVCLVDNSPISYTVNEANGIPIEGWTQDPSDEALLDLLPVLDSLRFTSDVRRVLGLRSAGGVHFAMTSSPAMS